MEIIIHDLPEEKLKTIYGIIDNSLVITNNKKIKSCINIKKVLLIYDIILLYLILKKGII